MTTNKNHVRRGHCENFTNCVLADNGDIQEVSEGDDFKCSLCGRDLIEESPKPKKIWIWLCLVAIMIIMAVIWLRPSPHSSEPVVDIIDTVYNGCGDTIFIKGTDTVGIKENTQIDTTYNEHGDTVIKMGCKILETKRVKKSMPPSSPIPPESSISTSDKLPVYGNYYGPRNELGEPHGKGGRVDVTIEYHWGYHVFSPGDRIVNTVFERGMLRSGKVHTKDGITYEI